MTKDEFLECWRDVWIVFRTQAEPDVGGLGRVTAKADDQGSIVVNWRLDIAQGDSVRDGCPDEAQARAWFENRLVLDDVATFSWLSYRSLEASTPGAAATLARNYASDVRLEPVPTAATAAKLRVFPVGAAATELDAAGDGPIVPDVLIGVYATTQPRERGDPLPVRFLGFERDPEGGGRRFATWHGRVCYAGRKGPQTGLSHTFESNPLPDGRAFSAWVDDRGRFIGTGDEREVFLAAPDEEAARAFLRAGGVAA